MGSYKNRRPSKTTPTSISSAKIRNASLLSSNSEMWQAGPWYGGSGLRSMQHNMVGMQQRMVAMPMQMGNIVHAQQLQFRRKDQGMQDQGYP